MTPLTQAFSSALLHFIWQGAGVTMLLSMVLFALRRGSARARYAAGCLALAVLALLPVITTGWLYTPVPVIAAKAVFTFADSEPIRTTIVDPVIRPSAWLLAVQAWALPAWSIGVLLFALRLLWGCRRVSLLRRSGAPASDDNAVTQTVARLAGRLGIGRLGINRSIRVLISAIADGPSVVGWLRPVILLPAATIAGLTSDQLEAVLAHELAHIRRHDYLVNLLQTVAETLLFYHPAVWWISGRIRDERELCCDDLAVACCGDAVCYARALTELEKLRLAPVMAIGATSGPLLYRIQRLLGVASQEYGPSRLTGLIVLAVGLTGAAANIAWARREPAKPKPPAPAPVAATQEAGQTAFAYHNQNQKDASMIGRGVKADPQGVEILHMAPVEYPRAAAAAGIKGKVVVEATVDNNGGVADVRVVVGPLELRRAALQSVLQWHFAKVNAGAIRQVAVMFESPEAVKESVRGVITGTTEPTSGDERELAQLEQMERGLQNRIKEREQQIPEAQRRLEELRKQYTSTHPTVRQEVKELEERERDLLQTREQLSRLNAAKGDGDAEKVLREISAQQERLSIANGQLILTREPNSGVEGRSVAKIEMVGIAENIRQQLAGRLPIHIGDTMTHEAREAATKILAEFDSHLQVHYSPMEGGKVAIVIAVPGAVWRERSPELRPQR